MHTIAVYGASGHTGRFVVTELRRRGIAVILSGRDPARLPREKVRRATADDPASLDRALAGADAVINCAGPFAATAAPVIDAALRAQIPYLDIAAEVEAVADVLDRYAGAGIPIVPGMGFFGGLGDLLATSATGDWPDADSVSLAYALSSWHPTPGTLATGRVSARRRAGRRLRYANHRLEFRTGAAPRTTWTFPEPIGTREVVAEFVTADSVTIPAHLTVADIHSFMTVNAVEDLHAAEPAPPEPQTFLVEAVVRRGDETRRATARGRDIYAVTAPLVVEAAVRVLAGGTTGDAADVLRTLGLSGSRQPGGVLPPR